MTDQWTMMSIGDLGTVFDGPHATPAKTGTGPWFLSISSLKEGRLDLAESAHLNEADFAKWTRRVTPEGGDLLFSYETRLGAAALMPSGVRACLGRRMGLLRPNRERVDERFLLYAYLGPEFQREIAARAVRGATVDRIPIAEIAGWPLRVPPLRRQKAIAEVLGALDDKIAVNERIADTALALAKAQMEVVEHAEPLCVSDVADVFDGPHATPKKTTEGPWFLSISSLKGGVLDLAESAHLTEEDFPRWTRRVQPSKGDVLFSYETRLGEAALMPTGVRASLGRRMGLLRPKPGAVRSVLLLHAYLSPPFQEEIRRRTVHGATVDRIPLKEMPTWPIVLPAVSVRDRLSAALEALHASIDQAAVENRTLADLRNTLLPQLVTGKIRVKDAARVVEDVAS